METSHAAAPGQIELTLLDGGGGVGLGSIPIVGYSPASADSITHRFPESWLPDGEDSIEDLDRRRAERDCCPE